MERRRILRELHDELGQHLTAVHLMLAPLLKECPNGPLQGPLQQVAALVDRTVAALGGELDFSRRRGGGTCVCARLPLRPPLQPSRAAHP